MKIKLNKEENVLIVLCDRKKANLKIIQSKKKKK